MVIKMKEYEDTKLLSEDCMANRGFEGVRGGNKWLQKRVDIIKITHSKYGQILLDREEASNLKLFLEKTFEQEF